MTKEIDFLSLGKTDTSTTNGAKVINVEKKRDYLFLIHYYLLQKNKLILKMKILLKRL